jgi:hypothetical protein
LGWLGWWGAAGDRCRDRAPWGGGASLGMCGRRACGRGVGRGGSVPRRGALAAAAGCVRRRAAAAALAAALRVLGRWPKAAC